MKLMKLNIQKFASNGTLGTLSGQWKSTYTVSWSLLSQSTANNESTIRLTSTFYTGNSTTINSSNSSFITDGTTMYSGSYSQRGAGTIFSKTKDIVVKHNDDGSFPNRTVSFSAWDYGAFSASPSGSGTITGVPSIPRTSVLSNLITTISSDGKTVTLRPTITKYLSSFYDRLTLVNGSTIIAQIDGVSNNTSITLNDSQISALYREMGNSTSKSFSAYLTTYTSSSKSSTVGTSSSINTIVTLPDYDLSISSATIEDSITTYDSFKPKTNVFIANISKPKMTFSAISTTGNTYGNTISYRVNDVAVSSPYTVEDYKGDKYTLIATDGRKQTNKEFDMTVVPYFKPTIQATVKRTSPTGSTADVSIEGKYYLGNDLTNILTPTYIIKYTPKGGQQLSKNITVTTTTEGNEVTFKGTTQLTNLDYKKSIDWKVEITDIIGYVTSVSDTLKQGFPVWNAYEKNDEQYFNVNGVLSVKNKEILEFDTINEWEEKGEYGNLKQNGKYVYPYPYYPVGAIVLFGNNTNPNDIYIGKWEQLKDVFVLACGDKYKCGDTGGEEKVTLTIDTMPSHQHKAEEDKTHGEGAVYGKSSQGADTECWGTSRGSYKYLKEINTSSVGGNQPHNNMPPYVAKYCWERVA